MAKDQRVDYFNPQEENYTFKMPDGKAFVTFKKLTEGDWASLQSKRDTVEMDRTTQLMKVELGAGYMRMEVLEKAMVDWDIQTLKDEKWERVAFELKNVKAFLEGLNPSIIQDMYDFVVKHNPWLVKDASSTKDLKKRMTDLKGKLDKRKQEEKKS